MRSLFAVIRTLTLPAGAPPASPRIVIGPDIPPELVAWGATHTVTFYAVELFYFDATTYFWRAVASFSGQTMISEGTYDTTNGVYVTSRTLITGAGFPNVETRIGSSFLNTFLYSVELQQTYFEVTSDSTLAVDSGAAFTIDGRSAGRGLISFVAAQSDSAAIGAETAALTDGTSRTFKNGRAFVATYGARFAGSVANTIVTRFRKNTAAGTEFLAFSHPLTTADQWFSGENIFVNSSGSDVSFAPCFTIAATAGTATMRGATTIPRSIRIYDIGAAADYSNVPSV